MLDVQKAILDSVRVCGLTVGFQISNTFDIKRAAKILACRLDLCSAQECSVGILVKQQDDK